MKIKDLVNEAAGLARPYRISKGERKIGIFNRSYYEEVLVVRVHQQLLDNQFMPKELMGKDIWDQRYEDINNFEKYLTRNGVIVLKFFVHLSRSEQKAFSRTLGDARQELEIFHGRY